MAKTYCVLGGGGSFGLHTSKYLLDHADPKKVIAVGRNLPKADCFTLGIGDDDPRYSYHAIHVTYELDLLWNCSTARSRRSSSISPRRAKARSPGRNPGASSRPIRWRWRGSPRN